MTAHNDTYRATVDIFVAPGVRAFRPGEVVPAEVIENLGIQTKVAKEGTKAAQAALPSTGTPTPAK